MRFLPVLALLAAFALPAAAPAEELFEQKIHLSHIKPSVLRTRLDVLGGLSGGNRRMQFIASDADRTLTVRIPKSAGAAIERDLMFMQLRKTAQALDTPQPTIDLNMCVVQGDLLTEEEFATLDRTLRSAPLSIGTGATAKGVVFRKKAELNNEELYSIAETQAEARAQTRPEPVAVSGRVLPSVLPDGKVYLNVDLNATAQQRPFAEGHESLPVQSAGVSTTQQPIVLLAGKQLPMPAAKGELLTVRHEIMVYVWASPVAPTTKQITMR